MKKISLKSSKLLNDFYIIWCEISLVEESFCEASKKCQGMLKVFISTEQKGVQGYNDIMNDLY